MGELSTLKHNVRPSVFHEFLTVDGLVLLLCTCFFVLILGHVSSDLNIALNFNFLKN